MPFGNLRELAALPTTVTEGIEVATLPTEATEDRTDAIVGDVEDSSQL